MGSRWATIKEFRPPYLQVILSTFALIAAVQMLTHRDLIAPIFVSNHNIAQLLNDVALGYFASWLFYLLVVLLPDTIKRRRLRIWLAGRYFDLKDSLVMVYLSHVDHAWDEDLITSIRNPEGFAEFFCGRDKPDRARWDDVHNGLYEWGLSEIQRVCQLFVGDCDLVVGLIGNPSEEFLHRSGIIRNTLSFTLIAEPTYDDIKRLLNILFPLHCPWAVLDGKSSPDNMLKAIQSL